ncbi:MAG: tetratricopeptide repeat protein, partial [Candidatus Aminicenantes bacterium]|nr:tetratricopeptide repeat protein [Candidatus Aminicenantes bacterium]
VLAEVLSGKNPFHRSSTAEILSAVLRDEPEPLRLKPKSVNPAVGHIFQKALAKDPAKRYARIDEMGEDIRRVQAELASRAGWFLRKWPLLGAGAAILVAAFFGLWRIRSGPGTTQPAAAPAPIRVLVADFENRTGDPVFDGALEQTFALGLEEAPFVDLYRRADARRRVGQLDPTAAGRLDERLAQLVCRSEGIPVLIGGAIERKGGGYRLEVRAFDPLAARTLAELERTIRRKTQVIEEAMGLGLKMSSRLGGVPEETERALSRETFSTSSLEAMQAYDRAQDMARAGRNKEAIAEYERAIQEDPNFGRAYAGLAVIYCNSGDLRRGEEYQGQAMSLIDRMTEREKLRTRSNWYLMTKNYPKAIEECGHLVEQFPADSAGVSNLAMAYYLARDMDRAVEYGKRRVALNPQGVVARANLSWYYIGAGEFEQAETEAQQAITSSPEYEKAYLTAALSNAARGNPDAARSFYQRLADVSPRGASYASHGLADLALFEGRTSEAVKILAEAIAVDLEKMGAPDFAAQKMALLAQVELARGRKAQAAEAARRAAATSQKPEVMFLAGEILLLAGQAERAQALAAELRQKFEPEPQAYARIIEGEIVREKGQVQDAIRVLRDAQKVLDTWLGRFALGRAYLEVEAFTEAYSEFETCLKRKGEAAVVFLNDLPSARYMPVIHYYLGRAQEGLKSPAAKESYRTFLALKERAEADPLVSDARRRLKDL